MRLEQEVNRKLFARAIAGRQQPYVKLNTAAIVRANLEAQHRAMALGRQWGWLSANDCRRLLDMAPIGPEGDVYLTPMNMEPAPDEDAGEGETQSETVRRVEQLRRA